MIKIFRFRANDLDPSFGKQIEFNSNVVKDFFEFKNSEEKITFTFRTIPKGGPFDETSISVFLKLSPARGDYKIYENANGTMSLKTFFLNKLLLSRETNLSDYFALKKIGVSQYNMYYLPANTNIGTFLESIGDTLVDMESPTPSQQKQDFPLNLLLSGAPGTGKSFELERRRKENFDDEHMRRVTFYPNYTFAQFVGCYKPVMEKKTSVDSKGNVIEKKVIEYSYVPGPFIQTYVEAKNNPDEKFLLIIEELNRANAAAVFGDLFQLLDRKADGTGSEYTVAIGEDLKRYLTEQGVGDVDKLSLPSNMYIWATMNSADQGVFPLDTAFKRRWEYEHIGINMNETEILDKEFKVKNGDEWDVYNWNLFRIAINDRLLGKKVNEDKQLGPFYVNKSVFDSNAKALDAIKSKVLLYVFEDAGRQYRNSGLFDGFNSNELITYDSVCKKFDKLGGGIFGVEPVRREKTPPEDEDEIVEENQNDSPLSPITLRNYHRDLKHILDHMQINKEDVSDLTSEQAQVRIEEYIRTKMQLPKDIRRNYLSAYRRYVRHPWNLNAENE